MVEEDGLVIGIQFKKSDCPIDLAFQITETPNDISKATISGHDGFAIEVREHLDRAFSYLQCYFSTSINIDEVKITHEAETAEEEQAILLPSFSIGKKDNKPIDFGFDMLTRALMAAEDSDGPGFHSSLAQNARESWAARKYIDSFRYSFLLIEAIYGEGKFKSKALQEAFTSSTRLVKLVEDAVSDWSAPTPLTESSTDTLMQVKPSVADVLKHLIECRGHYFHGNLKNPRAWSQRNQDEAKSLAWLGLQISQIIAQDATTYMFESKFATRHFDEAGQMGAHVVMEIEFLFRVPEDVFIRRRRINFRMPGTKPTTVMAMETAKDAIDQFKKNVPVGRLHSVKGSKNGEEIFSLRFHIEPDGKIIEE